MEFSRFTMRPRANTLWILLVGLTCLHSSCVEQIDSSLLTRPRKVVIDGLVTDQQGPYYVKVSYSLDANNPGYPNHSTPEISKPINDAVVILADNIGHVDTLELWQSPSDTTRFQEWSDWGVYYTRHFPQARSGITYYLTVQHQGKSYEASATMPLPPPVIDQVTFKDFQSNYYNSIYKVPSVFFKEPRHQQNYYRFFYRGQNPTPDNGSSYIFNDPENFWPLVYQFYLVFDDQLLKPQVNDLLIPGQDIKFWPPRADINVQIHTITKEAFDYFRVLDEQVKNNGQIFSPVPTSPPTNISNGGLGFFIVASVSQKDVPHPFR